MHQNTCQPTSSSSMHAWTHSYSQTMISKSLSIPMRNPNFIQFLRSHHELTISHKKWWRPRPGCVKLNFDGASTHGTQNASIGGVYRNHEGAFVLGYAERIGKATSSVAELVAARRGLELALENGWMDLWMEGDAKVVVDVVVHGKRLKSKEDVVHAREIASMVQMMTSLCASHVTRRGNKVAHRLAKMGFAMKEPRVWRGAPPEEVVVLLRRDAEGAAAGGGGVGGGYSS